jgi:hypothetical protein
VCLVIFLWGFWFNSRNITIFFYCVAGIALNRGFGFVQYEQESSALEAIKQENGAMLRGKKMGRCDNKVEVVPVLNLVTTP